MRPPKNTARTSFSSATANATAPAATSPEASVVQISPSGRTASAFIPFANSLRFDGASGVPGLGFDFPHLAAISAGLANNSSGRFHRPGRRGQDSFSSILFWGYPYYYDDLSSDQAEQPETPPAQPQPQIIVIEQPAPAQQGADSAADAGGASTMSAAPADLPVSDGGNFILIRRDGRVLFASVFSVVGSQLQYVTPEGIRHTLELSDLDAEASQQMNEARGTTVQFHN